jgi:GntR family transcriptional regulator
VIVNLSDLSDEPLHAQISRQIRATILAGDLEGGQALPSIRGLAKIFRLTNVVTRPQQSTRCGSDVVGPRTISEISC